MVVETAEFARVITTHFYGTTRTFISGDGEHWVKVVQPRVLYIPSGALDGSVGSSGAVVSLSMMTWSDF